MALLILLMPYECTSMKLVVIEASMWLLLNYYCRTMSDKVCCVAIRNYFGELDCINGQKQLINWVSLKYICPVPY